MKSRILTFSDYIFEQENTEEKPPETEEQAKSRIARGLVRNLIGGVPGEDELKGDTDAFIEITKEVEGGLPSRGCGKSSPYRLNKRELPVSFFKNILQYLNEEEIADYSRAIKQLEEGKSIMFAIRNRLEVKKREGDVFCDALYFIPERSKDDSKITPYQITTLPSLHKYGNNPQNPNGTAIKAPGDSLYYLRHHKFNHQDYKMMVESEPINVYRYQKGTTRFETYKPGTLLKQNCGLHIHKSSKQKNVCVGEWSSGCQVFDEESSFNDFIRKAENQSSNQGKFYYALVELDSIPNKIFNKFASNKQVS